MLRLDDNTKHCKAIADELYEIVNGAYVNIDGDPVEIKEDENGNEYAENNGEMYTGDELEALELYTLYDYFEGCLDINYLVQSDRKTYKAVRVLVAYGGPNIYISTITGKVELYWWTDRAEWYLDNSVVTEIDSFFEELYFC